MSRRDDRHKNVEVLSPFTGTEIDAKAGGINFAFEQPGCLHRVYSGTDRKPNIAARVLENFGLIDPFREVVVLDLGGNFGRKIGGVEVGDTANAAAPGEHRIPGVVN